jgi:Cyclin, N-terminal domain
LGEYETGREGWIELAVPMSISVRDGVPQDVERVQLAYGADLIVECGVLLRLPRVAIVSAQVLFQRFYVVVSLKAHGHVWMAAAALLVASKAEEQPRRIRHIANVVYHSFCTREGLGAVRSGNASAVSDAADTVKLLPLDYYGPLGYDWKCGIVDAERHLLKELGFRVLVDHAHKFVLVFVNTLRDKSGCANWENVNSFDVDADAAADADGAANSWQEVLQRSWCYANDAQRMQGPAALEAPESVACACISLSARDIGLELPARWQEVFGGAAGGAALEATIKEASLVTMTAGRFVDVARSAIANLCGPRIAQTGLSSAIEVETR